MNDDTPDRPREDTRVWDAPLRLFHWLLVLCLAGSWATHELGTAWMDWHVRLGYLALGLMIFRVIWGFVGPRHARFASFLTGPGPALTYGKGLLAGKPPASPGHSPLAGWAVMAMLTLVTLQAVSGLFKADDFLIEGPWHHAAPGWLKDFMARLHHTNFDVLLGMIALHLGAIAFYRWRLKSDLVGPMVTGRRLAPAAAGIDSNRWITALIVAALAASAVWLIVALAPQPDPGALYY